MSKHAFVILIAALASIGPSSARAQGATNEGNGTRASELPRLKVSAFITRVDLTHGKQPYNELVLQPRGDGLWFGEITEDPTEEGGAPQVRHRLIQVLLQINSDSGNYHLKAGVLVQEESGPDRFAGQYATSQLTTRQVTFECDTTEGVQVKLGQVQGVNSVFLAEALASPPDE